MLDFVLFKIDIADLVLLLTKVLFAGIGLVYIIYVLLQLRQIGIMNSTLKTRAAGPIVLVGLAHLLLVIIVILFIEIVLITQGS